MAWAHSRKGAAGRGIYSLPVRGGDRVQFGAAGHGRKRLAGTILRATPRGFYLARLTGLGGAYDGYIAPCITIEVLVLTPLCIA